MTEKQKKKSPHASDKRPLTALGREPIRGLLALSGRDALNRIFELKNPHRFVQNLAHIDFFWLIKMVGEDDCFPILEMASLEQWQYLLDMELWQKDRLDMEQTTNWLGRLQKSHGERLVRWLFSDGELLSYYYFFKIIQVEIVDEDEDNDFSDDFFTFDSLYYIRILDKDNEDVIRNILRQMAQEDYDRYQALLLGLAGVSSVEVEAEMSRMRSIRLAENGFLPYDEAISLYAHLKAESLTFEESPYKLQFSSDKETRALIPIAPLIHVQGNDLLSQSIEGITDNLFLDRIRIEFAGLCNQISSADGLMVSDIRALTGICRKAAGYINLGLERLSGDNITLSVEFLKKNPLISLFRVGFGLSLELKWEAEKWFKDAWFFRQNFELNFWGDDWGGTLTGILQKRPRLFTFLHGEEEYKDFERLSEIEDCRIILHRLSLMDRLLGVLTARDPFDRDKIKGPSFNFHPLLFNFWARKQLSLDPGFAPLSLEQVRDFFRLLRAGSPGPPYRMPGFRDIFIKDFTSFIPDIELEDARILKETLSLLWQGFFEEYAFVATAELDGRFIKFILTRPSS